MLKLKFVLDVFQNGFTSPLYTKSLFGFIMSARIYVKNLFSLCEKRFFVVPVMAALHNKLTIQNVILNKGGRSADFCADFVSADPNPKVSF